MRLHILTVGSCIRLTLALASVVFAGLSNGAEPATKKTSDRQDVAIIVHQRGVKQRLTSVLDEKLGKEIEKIPGVVAATPGLVDFTSLEGQEDDIVVVQGWAADSPLMKTLDIVSGRNLKKDDAKCLLLGKELAAALKKKAGDKIQAYDKAAFTVVGIFQSPIVYESHGMVMLLPDLQRIMGCKGQVTGFAVIVNHPENKAEVDRIIKAITALGPKIDAKPMQKPPNETEKTER